jgi:GT2 family glycosyltransferase
MISIVIPTYNRGYTLSIVLDSFYQQKNVKELIVVDDGGSDDTAVVVDQCSGKYPLVETIYLRNEKREGAPYSRQRGFGQPAENLCCSVTTIIIWKKTTQKSVWKNWKRCRQQLFREGIVTEIEERT